MKKISLGLVFLGVVFSLLGPATAQAVGPQWIDATHIFDAQVQKLVQNVKIETKVDFAKRNKAPAPQVKQYKVGDSETFWTKNIALDKFEQVTATLKSIGKNCYIFVEDGRNVSEKAVEKVQKSFDEVIYKTDTTTFGSEWSPGIDGDERITLLMFDIKDGFNGSGGFVAGYFFAGDEFLQSQTPANVPVKSNEREMFYLDINPADPDSDDYMAVVAHEFQHMIHFANDPKERTWANEGCSQIAPYLCGFGHASQIMSLLQTPDNSLTAWAPEQMLANYGQVYLWNYYLMNRFFPTEQARTKFFKTLVADKATGIAGFDKALKPFKTDFSQAFRDFAITNFVNDPKLGKGEFTYDKTLARLHFPIAQAIKTLPGQVQEKVFLWSADAITVDLGSVKSSLKVEFAGAYAKFSRAKFNSFNVAAVLSNSRGSAVPSIQYLDLKPVPEKKVLAGVLELASQEKYDTMMLVVSAQAPDGIADEAYAKAPQLPYVVRVSDSGAIVTRANTPARGSSVRGFAEEYARVAADLGNSDEKISALAFINIESLSHDMEKTVRAQAETGSFEAVDELLSLGEKDASREALRPLARKFADQLKFSQNSTDVPDLESRIQALKSF